MKKLNIKGLKGSAVKTEIEDTMSVNILEMMNQPGSNHWSKNWSTSSAMNQDGTPYRGYNALILPWVKYDMGYKSDYWGTFKNWKSKGFSVKKGESSTAIIFSSPILEDYVDKDGKTKQRPKFWLYKVYSVFNAHQVQNEQGKLASNCEPYMMKRPAEVNFTMDLTQKVIDSYLTSQDIELKEGGNRAYYSPSQDFIGMPKKSSFFDNGVTAEHSYKSTLLHEIGHSTGHESRLKRPFNNMFGDDDYAFEELIAEFTAVFMSAHTGLAVSPPMNHASYIKSWNKRYQEDSRYIVKAISKASKACQFIMDNSCLAEQQEEEVKEKPVKYETVALIKRSA